VTRRRAWAAYAIVFVASAATLVLEIAAGRLLASYFGVSLYTWTSIIGVVLLGIAVGNYCGGYVADLAGTRRTLGLVLATAGMTSLAILPFTTIDLLGRLPPGLPPLLRIVLVTALFFFAPSALLGMVSPLVVRRTLGDLGEAGRVVGRIYAWSTVGSIAGTLLTGFVLIPWLGTRAVIFAVGAVLIALAAVTGEFFRAAGWPRLVDAALVLFLVMNLAQIRLGGALEQWCHRETGYYCIRVVAERQEDGHEYRVLSLDHLIHSYNSLEDPTRLHYPYIRTYAALTGDVAARTPRLRALFIGGGGYTLPRYMEALYPDATLEVAEIDPGVTATAIEMLGLRPDTRVVTYNRDAREVVEAKQGTAKYDLVFGDAFNDFQIPYHLTTREFAQKVRNLLAPEGLYLALVIDRMRGGRFMASVVRTLQDVFPHVYVLSDVPGTLGSRARTYVVAAGDTALDVERVRRLPWRGPSGETTVGVMPPEALEEWLREADPVVLTDDYAPADNLLAPIFLQRGS
jgi:spermidine synthase